MVKLRGFRFSFNLSALNNKQKEFDDYPYQPQYSTTTGAYKSNNDEFIAPTSSLPQVNRIRPSMVKLPASGEQRKTNMVNLKLNVDDDQGNSSIAQTEPIQAVKSILKTQPTNQESSMNTQVEENLNIRQGNDGYLAPPPMVPKNDTIVSNNPKGAESSKAIKQTTKEQKKLEKNQEKEQKKLEKYQENERKRLEKQQAAEAKKEEIEQKKRQQELKKKQEKEAKIAMQQEKKTKKNKTTAPKPKANKSAANPLAQNSNPLAQTPQPSPRTVDPAPVQSTTPESTISRTTGPPPYSEIVNNKIAPAEVMQSKIDPTGNTSFGKPVDSGSWDLISQHRQQIGRPVTNTALQSGPGNRKQIVMDLNFKGNDPRKSIYT